MDDQAGATVYGQPAGNDEGRLATMEAELAALRAENARLRGLLGFDDRAAGTASAWSPTLFGGGATADRPQAGVDRDAAPEAKVALFRSLFSGRDDVFALRWENEQTGKSGWAPAVRGGWKNAKRPDREYLSFTDEVVERHLAGGIHAGVYPLLRGDACRLLACDFDGPGWALDALAYHDAASAAGIPAALERSRSGDGGHVWVLFAGSVPATSARRIGVHLLREAMTVRGEIDLASYDRLFPAQDFMPKGSFGNLIALPLQGTCRKRGTTVFLDPSSLEPFEDQWAFLSTVEPLSTDAVDALARGFGELAVGPDSSTYRRPAGSSSGPKPPAGIAARSGAMLPSTGSGFHRPCSLRSSTWRRCTTRSSTRRRSSGFLPGTRPGSSAATARPSTSSAFPGDFTPRPPNSWPTPAAASR